MGEPNFRDERVGGVVKDELVREVVKEAFTPVLLEETWSVNEETPEIKQI